MDNKAQKYEEVLARVQRSLAKKRACVAEMEAYAKQQCEKRTGKPVKYLFSM